MTSSVTVVVPTYCEAANLPVLVPRVDTALANVVARREILVIDDDSPDATVPVCAELAAHYPLRLLVRKGQRGLASAVLFGLRQAAGEVLVVMDADLSHPPERIPDLIQPILSGDCDLTVGSRYAAGGHIVRGWGWYRHLNSRIATFLARPLTPVRDCLSGFFALHRRWLDTAGPLTLIGYKVLLELIVKCRPPRIREVPILFGDRLNGSSKLSWREQVNYLRHLGRLYRYQLGRFDPPPATTPAASVPGPCPVANAATPAARTAPPAG